MGWTSLMIKVTAAVVIDVSFDGESTPLTFARGEQLDAVAQRWVDSHPGVVGAGCDHASCVASKLVRTMRQAMGAVEMLDFEEDVVDIARRAKACGVSSEAATALRVVDATAFGLEQTAGLCFVASEFDCEECAGVAALAAVASVRRDPRRGHALKFGAWAAYEVDRPELAAWFWSALAKLKRPARGASLLDPSLPEGVSPWTVRAPGLVRVDQAFEFGYVQYGGLHDAVLEHAGGQLRWILENTDATHCEATRDELRAAADAIDAAAREAQKRRGVAEHLKLADLGTQTFLGRAVCILESPRLADVIRSRDDVDRVVDAFNAAGVAVVDDFLTDEALAELRRFVLGSTIFTRAYIQGYLGAFLGDGFGASPLVLQVAADLRYRIFPRLLNDTTFRQAWAYVYPRRGDDGASHPRGIDPHADDADVSVNLWITPDDANLGRTGGGGLIIYDTVPPDDWTFSRANRDSVSINALLEGGAANATTVPYKCNRLTLLDGYRFHRTDDLDFKPGHANHRINLTFLFRKRHRPSPFV